MYRTRAIAQILVSIMLLLYWPLSHAAQSSCTSLSNAVKGVTDPAVRTTAVAFNSNPARFDPVPLLDTTITVGGTIASCLMAHFSAEARPLDNWVVFQVTVDGAPMQGHAALLAGLPPVVFDPDETQLGDSFNGIGPYRMVAYDFFANVRPGPHRIQVWFAGCCSANINGSGAHVQSPVLTLEYRAP